MRKLTIAMLAAVPVLALASWACNKPCCTLEKAPADTGNQASGAANMGQTFKPTIQITPAEAKVAPGGTLQFRASINYVPNGPQYIRQPVEFLVEEKDGGKIEWGGQYTAPDKPGTYHVIARREDFTQIQAKATVVVKEK